ncbi:MAG TPA: glycosyl hydrolase [Thermoleophilaceae bacterium]|jgi:hypothetical protein
MTPARRLATALFGTAAAAALIAAPAAGAPDRVAVGAYIPGAAAHPSLINRYARQVGRRPAIVVWYRRFDERPFDARTLTRVARRGALPMVTWEPWDRPLRDIANGEYDGYLRRSARAAADWGRPIMVRFAHEMNGDWYPWGEGVDGNVARDYVRAWRRIVRIFRGQKARNVRWMWAPNADDKSGNPPSRRLYPGDRYVDWVGLSGFSWGGPWDWKSARAIFRDSYHEVERISSRPVAIAEIGASEIGGDKADWIRQTFARDLVRMARVRAVIWFNGRKNWANWNVDSSPRALAAFRSALALPRYAGTARNIVGSALKHRWGTVPGMPPPTSAR